MSTLKTSALRGISGSADSMQLHASNQSVTFPGAVTFSGAVTGDNNDNGLPCFYTKATSSFTLDGNSWLQLNPSEVVDSASAWDTTNKRFTPQTAGYYFTWASLTTRMLDAAHWVYLRVYKNGTNGTLVSESQTNGRNATYHNWINQSNQGIVSMNGSSDYLELWLMHAPDSGTTALTFTVREFGAFRLGPN
jgi:hypothetical protein